MLLKHFKDIGASFAEVTEVKAFVTGHNATHRVPSIPTQPSARLIYSNLDFDKAEISIEFMQCQPFNRAQYLVEWNADWGPQDEVYTVLRQIGSGIWESAPNSQLKAWSFSIEGDERFRFKIKYAVDSVESPEFTTGYRTAPACGGGGLPF